MGIIIDLDQTLLDTSSAEVFRKNRDWQAVYKQIPTFKPYPFINDLMALLIQKEISVCIVTSSPEPYCKRVLTHFDWNIGMTVCFHDTARRKPHPEPINRALEIMKEPPENVFSAGDQVNDIIASQEAGVKSIACLWGSDEAEQLMRSSPDLVMKHSKELFEFVRDNH